MTILVTPPTYTPIFRPLIFLAGPIQGAEDWQTKAVRVIQSLNPEIAIASPRRALFSKAFDYDEQVDWETYYLNAASEIGVILFWLATEKESISGRAYAQTSRAELFEWKERYINGHTRLALGIEEGFSGARYIRKRFGQDCPALTIRTSLESVCQDACAQIAKL